MPLLSSTKSTKVHLLELEAFRALGTPNRTNLERTKDQEVFPMNVSMVSQTHHLLRCALDRCVDGQSKNAEEESIEHAKDGRPAVIWVLLGTHGTVVAKPFFHRLVDPSPRLPG